MRIISGSCRGRKLVPLTGRSVRPTSDRVRESIFNILSFQIPDARILDLFCGTGALGLEALSRGASQAVFMDHDLKTVRQNLALCRMGDRARIIQTDLGQPRALSALQDRTFDLVFMDPPYGKGFARNLLASPSLLDRLTPNTILVVEHGASEKLAADQRLLDIYRQKKYSRTMISFIRKKKEP